MAIYVIDTLKPKNNGQFPVAEATNIVYGNTDLSSTISGLIDDVSAANGAITSLGNDKADKDSPELTGTPTAPTASLEDSSTQVATTEFVKSQGYTTNEGTVTSVDVTVPTGLTSTGGPVTTSGTVNIELANGYLIPTQEVIDGKADLSSPEFSGTPTAPTAPSSDSTTKIATTEFVKSQGYTTNEGTVTSVGISVPTGLTSTGGPLTTAGTISIGLDVGYVIPTQSTLNSKANLNSPEFSGTPTSVTPTVGDNSTQIATTAFVTTAINNAIVAALGGDY